MRLLSFALPLGLSALAACGPPYNPAREAIDAAKAAAEVPAPAVSETHWTCPMHPEVQAKEAGDCPQCKMPLVAGDTVKAGGR